MGRSRLWLAFRAETFMRVCRSLLSGRSNKQGLPHQLCWSCLEVSLSMRSKECAGYRPKGRNDELAHLAYAKIQWFMLIRYSLHHQVTSLHTAQDISHSHIKNNERCRSRGRAYRELGVEFSGPAPKDVTLSTDSTSSPFLCNLCGSDTDKWQTLSISPTFHFPSSSPDSPQT